MKMRMLKMIVGGLVTSSSPAIAGCIFDAQQNVHICSSHPSVVSERTSPSAVERSRPMVGSERSQHQSTVSVRSRPRAASERSHPSVRPQAFRPASALASEGRFVMQASEPLRMPASLANPTGSSSGVPATPQNAWAEPNERWTVIENQARGIGDLKKAQPATSAAALQN